MDHRDLISSVTHLSMAVWGVFATLFILYRTRGHGRNRRVVGWYGFSLVLLYLSSGIFHGLLYLAIGPSTGFREQAVAMFSFFQKLDKSAIFLLIAMSNVVVMVYLLPSLWRVWCVTMMLTCATLGITAIWVFPSLPHPILVGIYAGMGVSGMLPFRIYGRVLGWRGYRWVFAFAVLFLTGAAFEVFRWSPVIIPGYFGYHEMLHIAIMGGSFVHFVFLNRYVIIHPPRADKNSIAAGSRSGYHRSVPKSGSWRSSAATSAVPPNLC